MGRVMAVHFAVEGADVAICYFPAEQQDAEKVREIV